MLLVSQPDWHGQLDLKYIKTAWNDDDDDDGNDDAA